MYLLIAEEFQGYQEGLLWVMQYEINTLRGLKSILSTMPTVLKS